MGENEMMIEVGRLVRVLKVREREWEIGNR